MSLAVKIALGIVGGFLLLFVGCVVLIGIGASQVDDISSVGSVPSAQESGQTLADAYGCQWILDTYNSMAVLGHETAVSNLATEMTLKADVWTYIGSGDAAEALRQCGGR